MRERGNGIFDRHPISRIRDLVSRIIYSRLNDEMRHGLFPKDDISERDSTESLRDLPFEGLKDRFSYKS